MGATRVPHRRVGWRRGWNAGAGQRRILVSAGSGGPHFDSEELRELSGHPGQARVFTYGSDEPGQTELRAIYFDNEGHTIHYTVEPSANGNSVQFVSDAVASQPSYRLTYSKAGDDGVAIRFEIAPPGAAGKFSTYIEAKARRKR